MPHAYEYCFTRTFSKTGIILSLFFMTFYIVMNLLLFIGQNEVGWYIFLLNQPAAFAILLTQVVFEMMYLFIYVSVVQYLLRCFAFAVSPTATNIGCYFINSHENQKKERLNCIIKLVSLHELLVYMLFLVFGLKPLKEF